MNMTKIIGEVFKSALNCAGAEGAGAYYSETEVSNDQVSVRPSAMGGAMGEVTVIIGVIFKTIFKVLQKTVISRPLN